MTTGLPDIAGRTVGELVAEDFRRAPVFKRFGIDFCCGGGGPLGAVCEKKGLNVEEVAAALADAPAAGAGRDDLRVASWSPAFLADYIVNQHHSYVRSQTPALLAFTEKVARVHGPARPELVDIAALFAEVAEELFSHMSDEETQVFPRIRDGAPAAELAGAIERLEAEHERAGALMAEIRRLADDFRLPAGACATYRAAFVNLEAFEDDLHRHVHLENNVLFPKVAV